MRFLRGHPGHAFCDECLALRLGVTLRHVRHARIALAGSMEFDQEVWFCSSCLAQKHVMHLAWMCFDVPYPNEDPPSELDE